MAFDVNKIEKHKNIFGTKPAIYQEENTIKSEVNKSLQPVSLETHQNTEEKVVKAEKEKKNSDKSQPKKENNNTSKGIQKNEKGHVQFWTTAENRAEIDAYIEVKKADGLYKADILLEAIKEYMKKHPIPEELKVIYDFELKKIKKNLGIN